MEKGNFLHEFLAGNIGGLIGICTVYPLDTAKMRLQVCPGKYTGTYNVLTTMVREQGVTSMYRGLFAPSIGFGFTFAVSFSAYGHGCRVISSYKVQDIKDLTFWDTMLAGAYTGVVQTPVRQVVDRFKGVMQIREREGGKSPYSWTGACAVDLIRKEGWRNGLFQGMNSTLLRELPQFAVYYPTYEVCKVLYKEYFSNPVVANFLAGGTAGVIQWLPPIYCFDVIKSRMQCAPRGHYSGVLDCASKLLREEGWRVFFRGLTPAIFRAFPLHAIIFVTYEMVMIYLK